MLKYGQVDFTGVFVGVGQEQDVVDVLILEVVDSVADMWCINDVGVLQQELLVILFRVV